MRSLVLIFLLTAVATGVSAQHRHESSPPPPPDLQSGMGDHSHPITTKNTDAQKYFDRGLAYLYAFNHDEATRYFRRATELDPDAPMPYWGLAMAIGPNYNDVEVDERRAAATYDAVRKAIDRTGNASATEQDYVRALAKRYPSPDPKSDWKQLHLDYSNAMRDLVQKYPDDLDLATMFAESLMMLRPWQLWTSDGNPAPGTLELVSALESVLKREPNHPGANHFYIHAVEASPNLERAIPSAMRLMTLMPAAGHLVHMPGHIFLQTGDYDLAAETNVKASAADRAFVLRTGTFGMYPLMYWTHNMHFIAYARAQQGRYDEAIQAARDMVRNVGDSDLQPKMQILEGFLLYPLMVDLRFHRWDDILRASAPRGERKLSTAFRQYARAMAFAGQGKLSEAAATRREFEALRQALPPEAMYIVNNKASDLLALSAATLDAHLAGARGEKDEAIRLWKRAIEVEKTIQYDEPPPWFYPVRQSLGAALLKNGQAKEAEVVFREAITKQPRDGRLLFGLWQSLVAQKREDEAAMVRGQFESAWKGATMKLTIEDL
ncbi:MAG TPA: tetratricopeptide repeat protein [Thermoanaerobaculia bacterium]|nr:tetratricopeptide repeat protein [Thermoanaerobaculia bacterium]